MVAARQNAAAFSVPSGQIRSAYEDKKQPRLTIVKLAGVQTLKGDSSGVVVRTGPTDLSPILSNSAPAASSISTRGRWSKRGGGPLRGAAGCGGIVELENSRHLNQRGEFLIHRKIRFPGALRPCPQRSFRSAASRCRRPSDGAKVISGETGQQIKSQREQIAGWAKAAGVSRFCDVNPSAAPTFGIPRVAASRWARFALPYLRAVWANICHASDKTLFVVARSRNQEKT